MDYAYKFGGGLIRGQDEVPQTGLNVTNLWNKVNGGIEYGVTDKFTVGVEFPYSFNSRAEGNHNNYYWSNGWGDVTLKGRYWFKTPDPRGWNFYVAPSVAIPNGSDYELDFNGGIKKPYIVPGMGQWQPSVSAGMQKGFGMDNGMTRLNISANIGYLWYVGTNNAGYHSANPWFGSAGASWIPFHFGEELDRFFGLGFYVTEVHIAGWDTRNGVKVNNTGGKWIDINPGIFFTPDNGKFTASLSIAKPVYVKVHSLQTLEALSYSVGVAYRF